MTKTVSTKDLVYYLFTKNKDSDSKYTCLCSVEPTQNDLRYTNLHDHFKRAHSDYYETVLVAKKKGFQGGLLKKTTVSDKAINIHGCSEVVMGGVESFSFAEK